MDYDFRRIEQKWQARWAAEKTFRAVEDPSKPKYYVLDMFPYPSGAGLHVGHPLGYIASDIYARYKRLKGFNVLHPMGYDAFGLPAEQYAIQTGQHPEVTTVKNIARYREQLDRNRIFLRLGQGSPHMRSSILQMDSVGVHQDVQELLQYGIGQGSSYFRIGRCVRAVRYQGYSRCMHRGIDLYRRRMEVLEREEESRGPDELSYCISGRNISQLVPWTRYGACQ